MLPARDKNMLARWAQLESVRLCWLRRVEGITLFDFFDECAEAGSLGRKEQKEDQAKITA